MGKFYTVLLFQATPRILELCCTLLGSVLQTCVLAYLLVTRVNQHPQSWSYEDSQWFHLCSGGSLGQALSRGGALWPGSLCHEALGPARAGCLGAMGPFPHHVGASLLPCLPCDMEASPDFLDGVVLLYFLLPSHSLVKVLRKGKLM